MKSFFTKYQPKDKTVGGEYGTPTLITPPKKTYGSIAEEFKEMDEVVKNLDNTISSLKDGNFDSISSFHKL